MSIEQILAILGLIGIGSVIPTVVSYFVTAKSKKSDSKQELKEKRYKAILLLCYSFVNYEKENSTLLINRPDLKSKQSLFNELNAEWFNMSLYASDAVILGMKKLLENQTKYEFNRLVIEMRKDLYSLKTKLKDDVFNLKEDN